MSDVLFEITDKHLYKSLNNVPVGYCVTSLVDPNKGLSYVGHPIEDICYWSPEEVMFLLYHKRQGKASEVQDFLVGLRKNSLLDNDTLEHIKRLPNHADPMDLMACAIQLVMMNIAQYKVDFRKDGLNIMSKMGTLTAAIINHHSNLNLNNFGIHSDLISSFINAIELKVKDIFLFKRALSLIFNLYIDHGGGSLPVFTAKAVSSSCSNIYRALATAMHAFAGNYYSHSLRSAFLFVKNITKHRYTKKRLLQLVNDMIADSKGIPGFSKDLKIEDKRATVLYDFANKELLKNDLVQNALLLRDTVYSLKKDYFAKADAINGVVLSAAGFDYPQYFLAIFAWARTVGIVTQVIYERLEAVNPKFRPKYIFKPDVV